MLLNNIYLLLNIHNISYYNIVILKYIIDISIAISIILLNYKYKIYKPTYSLAYY